MMRGTPSTPMTKSAGSITTRASLHTPAARQQSLILDSSSMGSEYISYVKLNELGEEVNTSRSNQLNQGYSSSVQFFEDLANLREKEIYGNWKNFFEKNRKLGILDNQRSNYRQDQEPSGLNYDSYSQYVNAFCQFNKGYVLGEELKKALEKYLEGNRTKEMAAHPSSATHQMQVRVTFYTCHNPQSVLMILKNDQALQQIKDKAQELFPSAEYRLYYGDVNGPIYEFTDSEQVMSKIRITTFSRTPQLFVRLEPVPAKKSSKGDRESKSSASLKRIEQNQESTLKSIEKLQKEVERLSGLESKIAGIQSKDPKEETPVEKVTRPFPPVKHSASCDACLGDIIGHRYKCLECADYDLCEKCEKKSVHYEHAMIRVVHPSKTIIPSYVTRNSPKNVFPAYMQNQRNAWGFRDDDPAFIKARDHVFNMTFPRKIVSTGAGAPASAPIPAPVAAPTAAPAAAPTAAPTAAPAAPAPGIAFVPGPEARFFNEETCAALLNSASILKDTFHTLSKSFMDLADGAQVNMDKKIIDRATMEAGVKKMEEKVETLKRHCEEKCFKMSQQDVEKVAESASKKAPEAPAGPKIKKAKKKTVYKKTAEKLTTVSMVAAAEEQLKEAKKRADASTAELQRKLAELNFKPATEEPRAEHITVTPAEPANSLEALMRAILTPPKINPPTTPAEPAEPMVPTPIVASAPLIFEPIYPNVETLIVPSLPVVEQKQEEVVVREATAPISIHSSFENISSDFESMSPTWEAYDAAEDAEVQDNAVTDEDLLDFADVAEVPAPSTSEPAPSLPPHDAETEKTFDRLLEMGFDYNVVVSAIKANGANLENCLAYLLQ